MRQALKEQLKVLEDSCENGAIRDTLVASSGISASK